MTKIQTLEVENLKRIKAVQLDCSGQALTVIGGNNGQGKTSVLDAIAYALGGERYRPTNAQRDDSIIPPEIRITFNNGIHVERKGKNSVLKVIDQNGNRGGQQLLNDFVHQFALDLPKFMNASDREKADALLQVIGVGEQLAKLDKEEKRLYTERHAQGQIADRKKKFAEEMPYHADAPDVPVSASDLLQQQHAIMATNAENQRKRDQFQAINERAEASEREVAQLAAQLESAKNRMEIARKDLVTARKTIAELQDESTDAIKTNLDQIESTNTKVRANLDKQKALDDSEEHSAQYDRLTLELSQVRIEKAKLLDGADLPLPGLSVQDGSLVYNGQAWDCMSSAEQLKVSTAIVRKLNPNCGFVLLDKLEQMDLKSLADFGKWLEAEGLQAIATRVSTGGECSIIIEDGTGTLEPATNPTTTPTFTPGSF